MPERLDFFLASFLGVTLIVAIVAIGASFLDMIRATGRRRGLQLPEAKDEWRQRRKSLSATSERER
jgi:hypothetical protein